MFISVVLPAPFSPRRPRISPRSRTRSMSALARTRPKLFEMPRISMRGVAMTRPASVGDRRGLVDVDAEIALEDLLPALLDEVLHLGGQLRLEGVIGREIGAALAHAREVAIVLRRE